jgi:hypothetical protein
MTYFGLPRVKQTPHRKTFPEFPELKLNRVYILQHVAVFLHNEPINLKLELHIFIQNRDYTG